MLQVNMCQPPILWYHKKNSLRRFPFLGFKKIDKNKNARLPITDNRAQVIDDAKIWKILNIFYFRYR